MNAEARQLGMLGKLARAAVCVVFAYWTIYVIVAPVTTIDAQMYNLARIWLAERGGLFGNPLFTSAYQVMWPWAFDAIHLPFLHLGFAYALPSFACMVGTCLVVFRMMRERFGPDAAWVAILSLFGLTCLIYQATSTKNDIAIVFGGAVWLYGRWRWMREKRGLHLGWMVLAIAFMAGAKTTGVVYGSLLSLWTLIEIRGNLRFCSRVCAGLVVAGILFGSVETYIESARVFGHPMGPPPIVQQLRNRDGLRGCLANMSRYLLGGIYTGPTTMPPQADPPKLLVKVGQKWLAFTRLTDAGLEPALGDKIMFFSQSGLEEFSGFGPVGTIAVLMMLLAVFRWKYDALWWRVAVSALGGLALVSFLTAYTQWSNRYLISWYALGTLAAICVLWENGTKWRRVLRWIFLFIAAASAVASPLLSFNRGPSAIVASIRDRDRFETCVAPIIGAVRTRLRELRAKSPHSRVCYITYNGSIVLPFLEDPLLETIVVTPAGFLRLVSTGQLGPGDFVIKDYGSDSHVLVEVARVSAPDLFKLEGMRSQSIYQITAPPSGAAGDGELPH